MASVWFAGAGLFSALIVEGRIYEWAPSVGWAVVGAYVGFGVAAAVREAK